MLSAKIFCLWFVFSAELLWAGELKQESTNYGPTISRKPSTVYWGDTHLHTNMSQDSYIDGNTQLGLDDAYRFALGEKVMSSNGVEAQLDRPLDFLVIADHASNMGVLRALGNRDKSPLLKHPALTGWKWYLNQIAQFSKKDKQKAVELREELFSHVFSDDISSGAIAGKDFQLSVWQEVIERAEEYNQPGIFTALIGFEWTPNIFNLHRVVIFRDGGEKVGKVLPFSQYDSKNPERLWDYLASFERNTGGKALAIPHNGNLSRGVMFALRDFSGNKLSRSYSKARQRWEPLFEVTQIKGDSETHPSLSNNDEFADFERLSWPKIGADNIAASNPFHTWITSNQASTNGDEWMHKFEYARSALKLGLLEERRLGVNPFKFGLIGGTDSHTSLATADEDNFFGKKTPLEPYSRRILQSWRGNEGADNAISGIYSLDWLRSAWTMNAAGYTGVWAEENTREFLFAAMKRKEVYASTGPRINVRFFGGWHYEKDDAFSPNLAHIGYEKGVPMGGDLTGAPKGLAPTFLIRAVKDPEGANLDRVQVIKGWHDSKGQLQERIYNVALADDRQDMGIDTGRVGNTVNVLEASYTNTIGDPELAVVWKDPDFDPTEPAFYYLRVIEIPTPRWTAYDAKYFQLKNIPEEIAMITQERAYSSPIWYSPNSME